jgi:hypothetical protein
MEKELILELMSDIECMCLSIEGEYGSLSTTIDDLVKDGDMPDSYMKLKKLLIEHEIKDHDYRHSI